MVTNSNFQRVDYTKAGYGKAILSDLINSDISKSRSYYNNMHNYSLYNTCLLLHQMALSGIEFSPCASFTRWKQLGYHVNKGQHGMTVLVPITVKYKAESASDYTTARVITGVANNSVTNINIIDLLEENSITNIQLTASI